jgi:hypothetical protein
VLTSVTQLVVDREFALPHTCQHLPHWMGLLDSLCFFLRLPLL